MRISNSFIPKFIFMEYCAILKRNLYIASSHYCLNQTFTFHERLMVQVWMNVHILCLEKLGSLTDICSLNFVECQTQLVLGVLFMQWISFCCNAILELLQTSSFFCHWDETPVLRRLSAPFVFRTLLRILTVKLARLPVPLQLPQL